MPGRRVNLPASVSGALEGERVWKTPPLWAYKVSRDEWLSDGGAEKGATRWAVNVFTAESQRWLPDYWNLNDLRFNFKCPRIAVTFPEKEHGYLLTSNNHVKWLYKQLEDYETAYIWNYQE